MSRTRTTNSGGQDLRGDDQYRVEWDTEGSDTRVRTLMCERLIGPGADDGAPCDHPDERGLITTGGHAQVLHNDYHTNLYRVPSSSEMADTWSSDIVLFRAIGLSSPVVVNRTVRT